MNDKKLNGLYAACEVGTTYGRLAAGVSLLKGLCIWHKAIIEEHDGLCLKSDQLARGLQQTSNTTGMGTSSGARSGTYWRCRDTADNLETVVTELRRRREAHNADLNQWTIAVREFLRLRESLLSLKTVNGFQVKLQSVIYVADHRDKWQGCLTTLHSIEGLHGNVLDLMPDFIFPRVLEHQRDKKANKGIRLGVETGEGMVRNFGRAWYPLVKTNAPRNFRNVYDKLLSSNAKCLERELAFVNQYLHTPLVRGQNITWGGHEEYRIVLKFARSIRQESLDAKRHEAYRRLHRIAGQSLHRQVNGIDQTPPETVGEIELTFLGGDGMQQTVMVPILQWLTVVPTKGKLELQEEFGAVFPAAYREFASSIATLHVPFTADREASIATLKTRLQAEFSVRFQGWEKWQGNAEQRKKQDRTLKATLLRKLRSIPELSLRDSYATGNCVSGTEQFCRQLGVTVDVIGGRELAKHWKRAGLPVNFQFTRVVEHVYDKMQNAGGVQ